MATWPIALRILGFSSSKFLSEKGGLASFSPKTLIQTTATTTALLLTTTTTTATRRGGDL